MKTAKGLRKVFECPHCGEYHGEEIRELQVLQERLGELVAAVAEREVDPHTAVERWLHPS